MSSNTLWISAAILLVLALAAGAVSLLVAMPGRSYAGPLDFTAGERALAARLRAHVKGLAATERNTDLERPARDIAAPLGGHRGEGVIGGGPPGGHLEAG